MNGKLVQPHITFFFDAGKRRDVPDIRMLGNLQILQNGARSHDAAFHLLNTKAFQRLGAKVFQQSLACALLGKHPIFQFKDTVFGAKMGIKIALVIAVVQHFLGRKAAQ